MTDIVERLRDAFNPTYWTSEIRTEAADEIERLREELSVSHTALEMKHDEIERLRALQPSGQTRQVKLDRVNAMAEELLQQLDAFQSNQHHSFVTTQQMAREAATVIRLLQAALQPSGQTRAEVIEECAKVAEWSHMVPPDGGSPTEEERAVAEAAARNIRALAAQEKEKTQT